MRVHDCVQCVEFPCEDVKHDRYAIPNVEVDPDRIRIVLVSEAAPDDPADHYYAGGSSLFEETTMLAFQDAGVEVASMADLLDLGVYCTTAVKCGKTGYGLKTPTIKACSALLGKELALFPQARAYLLMGDVAIRAFNYIAKRAGEKRVIPAGSTYKIRGSEFAFRGRRAFPSYLQAGPSFFIEKSKRRMIAEDIASAMSLPG